MERLPVDETLIVNLDSQISCFTYQYKRMKQKAKPILESYIILGIFLKFSEIFYEIKIKQIVRDMWVFKRNPEFITSNK